MKHRASAEDPADKSPIRGELFTIEQLARHAKAIASKHRLGVVHRANPLLERLSRNEIILREFNRSTLDVPTERHITPAAEWLLDNFYLIEEQIQMARRHLPRAYSRELPCLSNMLPPGLPRVYDIVIEFLSHTDAQIDAESLGAFTQSYQTVQSLDLGELWAVPIMLRLGLIENLQRIATRLLLARVDRDHADGWVNRLQEMAEKSPSHLVVVVADLAKSDPPVSSAFVAEFTERLSRQSPVLHLARSWLDQYLLGHGLTVEQLVHQENQNQAADQISVSHSISSLRQLAVIDWKDFLESQSLVEETLRSDPSGIYRKMDFATRDHCRHAIESLARHGKLSEADAALHAVQLAAANARTAKAEDRRSHVGYYLLDHGLGELSRISGTRWPLRVSVQHAIKRSPLVFYVGGIGLLTAAFVFGFLQLALSLGVPAGSAGILSILALICGSQLAVSLMNYLSTLLMTPRALPRLDFSHAIASGNRTIVVIPTLIASPDDVRELLEILELHYLSNRDPLLHFALLTDFHDADEETLSGDAALLELASAGIESLNQKHAQGDNHRFFLFHRPRRWNPAEGCWMGVERKRGKLAELNAFLRGDVIDGFSKIVGATSFLAGVKYVITLDSDTQLPRDVASRLVATMAHPLNRPRLDPVSGIVTEGYGILQPRLGVSLPGARRSWFVRLFSGNAGIDPYTRETSDVYQDVFGEGSFIGKGIYDVDAFEQSMHGRLPLNTVLSHDLLEGCHARAGLVSDVEFYEEFPSRYNVDVARRHRWIRGDWQIIQWLLPCVPGSDFKSVPNPLTPLSQWKIFDNLRRSLVPPATLILLIAVWLTFPAGGVIGVGIAIIIFGLSETLTGVRKVAFKPEQLPWALHLRIESAACAREVAQLLLTLTLLPYEALMSLDAASKTMFRLLITRKRLLEWQTSGDAEKRKCTGLAGFYSMMWASPAIAVFSGVAIGIVQPGELPWVIPILALWFAAPWIAWSISRPIESASPDLTAAQFAALGRLARKTWYFFETFVNAQENWLPPDNFQEIPSPRIASRTSPTNIGLALLANLAARDFGYLTTGGLIERTRNTLTTMHAMERNRGHFYNWYDTRTLQPLLPVYISSVDSGNLAGHLLTLAAGLREIADEPVCSTNIFAGLRDTLGVLRELGSTKNTLVELDAELSVNPITPAATVDSLKRAVTLANRIAASFEEGEGGQKEWSLRLKQDCEQHLEELELFALSTTWPTLREVANAAETNGSCQIQETARLRVVELEVLAAQADGMAAMDFAFLYDFTRDLFTTGFNVTEHRSDSGYYDLLASEARLCSYVAIALGQIPQEHWFSMGRLLVATHTEPTLVSWSGSMFEYLMPLLVMPNYDNSLLDHSCRMSVQLQIDYGKARGVPWGISESGYNRTDAQSNYQYRAFGVPGLGLKRGLAEDLVIAPYSTVMALMLAPHAACENLQRLTDEGREGPFGFYEAIDYTPARLPPDESSVTIQSYMAHHQGMSLLALVSLLRGCPMQRRFMSYPPLKAADLLLQERVPQAAASVLAEDLKMEDSRLLIGAAESVMRVCKNPTPPIPEVHLLSNGRYHLVISSAGSGYSRWRDLAVTRWREDGTRDCWGTFIFVRDVESGEFWSSAYQPTRHTTTGYEAIFTQSRAEFRQQNLEIETHTEICISPEDDVELRRITLTNRSSRTRTIELTSYAEVVLAFPAEEAAHPAFSNLFVQTEFAKESSSVLCTRRRRSQEENPPWLLHLMVGQGGEQGAISCETDRSKFIGRGGNLASPAAMQTGGNLSNTVGSVLDPVASLRRCVTLAAGESAIMNFVIGVSDSREGAHVLVEQYQSPRRADRAFDLAWTHSQVTLHHLNISEVEAQLYGRLASALIYADPARRAAQGILRSNRRGQTGLWSYGISGDSPIVIIHISDTDKIEIVRQLIRAHSYWRLKGFTVELMILNEDVSIYRQSLQDQITNLISSGVEAPMLDQRGGIFIRRIEQIPDEDLFLLQAAARVVLDDQKGTLSQQIGNRSVIDAVLPALMPSRSPVEYSSAPPERSDLVFTNGLGGFTRDGHEYVITLQPGQTTPAPWVNVIASPFFGTVVSESGAAYTWVENSHEFRLTPWSNDPVQDTTGEAFYIRDEQTGEFWSPSPLPARGATPYVVRHGFGYTVFEHMENGIVSELWVYVAIDAPVKFAVIKIRNVSGRPRRISITGYWEWVLGDLRSKSLMHVQTEVDLKTGALLARNSYNNDFLGRIAFLDVNDETRTITGDRKEFIGRNGSLAEPASMKKSRLSGNVGAGLDPCGAIQVTMDLHDGQERETTFRIGAGRDKTDVAALIRRYRSADAARTALDGVWEYWNRTLGAVNVDTPDPAVNLMANGWLLYQTISCRLWGRTGFYQSGGAYGFRDQLQDVMALVHADPSLTRAQILLAAAHQFSEGDVQHWWHPPAGNGVRTHFSDDFLWLPYVTCRYVSSVADVGVLDEKVAFLEGRLLKPEEEAYYDRPNRSEESATVYEHCVRAIKRGLNFGERGLPLIGCGDWNDGMNKVGDKGRGESVWLAFFLYDVLTKFSAVAEQRKDAAFAEHCLTEARTLKENIERHAWDGKWYRRAYFDDGEPLGSASSPECQIDSLPQSWSVLSGAGNPARAKIAMQSANDRLVREEAGLIQLFDPPFDKSALNPGYIKGYIPGVRENGGQYTHGAIWMAMAFAKMGDIDRAWDLFNLLNPINHGSTAGKIAIYKVEPYVAVADIYAVAPHIGRGGWTWYTGSAGWLYRLLVETLLGITREGDNLRICPQVPKSWSTYKVHYRFLQTVFHITITRRAPGAQESTTLSLDGQPLPDTLLPLVNDQREHHVEMHFV